LIKNKLIEPFLPISQLINHSFPQAYNTYRCNWPNKIFFIHMLRKNCSLWITVKI